MAIAFRSAASDDNASQVSVTQLKVTRPAGVQDGDFLVAAIGANGGASSSVIAPAGWTLVRRVDSGTGGGNISILVYYKFAAGEPSAGWSWSFGNANVHVATVRSYTGVDRFTPVDADTGASGLASTATVPAVNASTTGSLVLSCAAYRVAGSLSITPPSGYSDRVNRIQTAGDGNGLGVEGADTLIGVAGMTATATETFSGSSASALHVMTLRPSLATTTLEQARTSLKSHFPPGASDLYDWDNPDTDIYRLTLAAAQYLKQFGYDYVDLLQLQEFSPATAVLKLPDWEAALGISYGSASPANQWTATRQNAVVSKLREGGACTLANIRAAIEPLLGYSTANVGTLQVIETNRAALTAAHTYTNATGATIGAVGNAVQTVTVADDGVISAAGVQVTVTLTTAAVSLVSFVLLGPAGSAGQVSASWSAGYLGNGAASNSTYTLYLPSAAGKAINGVWNFTVQAGSAAVTLVNWAVIVEGAGRDSAGNDGLGASIFEWGVMAEPPKANSPDYIGARRALARMQPAYSKAKLLFQTQDTVHSTGYQNAAIPDDPLCLPDSVIPG